MVNTGLFLLALYFLFYDVLVSWATGAGADIATYILTGLVGGQLRSGAGRQHGAQPCCGAHHPRAEGHAQPARLNGIHKKLCLLLKRHSFFPENPP